MGAKYRHPAVPRSIAYSILYFAFLLEKKIYLKNLRDHTSHKCLKKDYRSQYKFYMSSDRRTKPLNAEKSVRRPA